MEPELSESKYVMTVDDWKKHKKDLEELKNLIGAYEVNIENLKTQGFAKDQVIVRLKSEYKKKETELTMKYNTTVQTLRATERELEGLAKLQQEFSEAVNQLKTKEAQLKAYSQVLSFVRDHVLNVNIELKDHAAEERIKILQEIVKKQIKIMDHVDWAGSSAEMIAFKRGLPVQDEEPGEGGKFGGKRITFKTVPSKDGFPENEEPIYE
jgi:chromosome segregation ATPase